MWKILEGLSLKQKLFFPSFMAGLISHLLVYLILVVGLDISFEWFQRIQGPIEINLYRSFKKIKEKKAVSRGARKIVPLEKISKETPREVVEEERVEADAGGLAASIAEAYLGSIYNRIERRKYYPEIEKEKYHEGVVRVGFVIKRDGSLENARIVRPSKYRGLNQAALQTVRKAAPFMPIPEQLKGNKLPIVIDIVYEII